MRSDRTPPRRPAALAALACATILALAAPEAPAQITPERLYHGVDRDVPMRVQRPAGTQGELSVRLLAAADASVVASATVPEGRVDLAGLFPMLWTAEDPSLLHAQLYVGERKVGPSVVLHPLITPDYARLVDVSSGEPVLPPVKPDGIRRDVLFKDDLAELRTARGLPPPPPRNPVFSGLRTYVYKHVVLETTEGPIELRLRPEYAPNMCFNFRHLVRGGWYTDIPFHRVVPGFVVQAGDPTGQGSGGPGYMVDLEPGTFQGRVFQHRFGVLSMARSTDPNTNGSQFFICLDRQTTANLDGRYTAFGEAVRGADALLAIADTPLQDQRSGRPVEPPRIKSARLIDAAPYGDGPPRVTRPEAEPEQR